MKMSRSGFGMALFVALALSPIVSLAEPIPAGGAEGSFNAKDLCGKWKVETPDGSSSNSSRIFEFFPDGRLLETSSHTTSQGESTNTYKKTWTVVGNNVLIAGPGQTENNGPSLTIEIPFDLTRLQIRETWDSPTSTRTTKMFAVREGSPILPASSVPSQPAASTQNPPPKPALTVTPSVKNDREGYYKTERISIGISLKNPSLRDSSGPLKVSYWILGKNCSDTKLFCLFTQGKFECDLGTNATNREVKQTTAPFLNKFYNYSGYSSSGDYAYEGWIVVVRDSDDRMVLIKATKPEWERQAEKLQALDTQGAFNLRLDKMEGAHGPYHYY